MIRIDNEYELMTFLKILSEEAVKNSKKQIVETTDGLADSFKSRLSTEKKELYEEDEEQTLPAAEKTDDASLQDPEEDSGENNDSEKPGESEQPAENQEETTALQASLDALERFINALRAAKSLKDSTVSKELQVWFDKQGQEEKTLMVLFTRELSRILSGEVSGANATDPNKEPYNLDVIQTSGGENKKNEPGSDVPTEDDKSAEDNQTNTANYFDEEEEEEDTSPPVPIKVGVAKQDVNEIRKRIQKLMSA